MEFEWDSAKHRIDFKDVTQMFDGNEYVWRATDKGDEERFALTGAIGPEYVTVIWTIRAGKVRIISARRARKNEREAYQTRYRID